MMMNRYSLNELLPILKELTEKYTSKESTSITYEKANQLMGAINYCIGEWERNETSKNDLMESNKVEAYYAYKIGYDLIKQKVNQLRNQYNEVSSYFKSYENRNYEDTFIIGIPQFFLRYDPLFDPHNHIITMDYPIIGKQPYEIYTGVDAMDMYIHAIELEQRFFSKLPDDLVFSILNNLPMNYKNYYFNICSIVLRNILISFTMKEKYKGKENEYYILLKCMCLQTKREELEYNFKKELALFIQKYYENDTCLLKYLSLDLTDFVIELQNAANNNCLENTVLF